MFETRLKLKNVVAIAICFIVFFAGDTLAQAYGPYTDASGVSWTYTLSGADGVSISTVTDLPASVEKWVIPEVITHNGTETRKVVVMGYAVFNDFPDNGNTTLKEIVFPKYMTLMDAAAFEVGIPGKGKIINLRKITFGEMLGSFTNFQNQPLESIVFKGDLILPHRFGYAVFASCPATAKVIVPCGKLADFVNSFTTYTDWWQSIGTRVTWTTANFHEAECLNLLTVLSSDLDLGNAISHSGGGILTTTTPDETSAEFSGVATLYALPKAGKIFVGWDDDNLDNPRTINVTEDITCTAIFANCENIISGMQETRSTPAAMQVYPNPADNKLNVQFEKPVYNGTLTLFDISGKIVLLQSITGNSSQINISRLPSGSYVLRLVEKGATNKGVKIIKQ